MPNRRFSKILYPKDILKNIVKDILKAIPKDFLEGILNKIGFMLFGVGEICIAQ